MARSTSQKDRLKAKLYQLCRCTKHRWRGIKITETKLKSKLALIKSHAIKLDYAKKKAEIWGESIQRTSDKMDSHIKYKYKSQEYPKLLNWYKNKVEYHLEKIKNHIEDSNITLMANKEVESNVRIFLKGDETNLKKGDFVDGTKLHKVN